MRQLFKTAQINPQKIALILDDQTWTYSELIEQIKCIASHLYNLNIVKGQIIYQFIERSFEMICSLFGIMYVGGVYCPLNPTDPQERLVSILEQTHGQYVLVHEKTRRQFPSTTVQQVVSLDQVLCSSSYVEDINELPNYTECGAALIVCTSGTTG
jgi:non-ribosomal peptide synthetase component F